LFLPHPAACAGKFIPSSLTPAVFMDTIVERFLAQTPKRESKRKVVREDSDPFAPTPAKLPRFTLPRHATVSAFASEVKEVGKPGHAAAVVAERIVDLPPAPPPDVEQRELLAKLFDGLESVLLLLSAQRCRPALTIIRESVERHTRRDLTEERLEQLLAAAEGMIDVAWLGRGSSAVLEGVQRTAAGETRPPTAAELPLRATRFRQAIFGADGGSAPPLRRRPLPLRPASPARCEPGASTPPVSRPLSATRGSVAAADGRSRLQALRSRIVAKQAASKLLVEHKAKLLDIEFHMKVCEDAMATHSIVAQLFARGSDADSAASEAEVLSAICSRNCGMQSRRPMDADAGRDAMRCLMAHSAGWFRVDAPQYSTRVGCFLRRLPGGIAADAMQSLKTEHRRLMEEHAKLMSSGPARVDPNDSMTQAKPAVVVAVDDGTRIDVGDAEPDDACAAILRAIAPAEDGMSGTGASRCSQASAEARHSESVAGQRFQEASQKLARRSQSAPMTIGRGAAAEEEEQRPPQRPPRRAATPAPCGEEIARRRRRHKCSAPARCRRCPSDR